MMRDHVERLLVILGAEEGLYARLRDVLQQQREVISSLDAATLEELTRIQEELCDEAHLLEEARLEVAGELATAFGLPPESTRLSELCTRLGPDASELREAHNRLVILVGVTRELLEEGALLMRSSLSEVGATLRALGTHLPEDVTYGPASGGSPRSGGEAGRLVRSSA